MSDTTRICVSLPTTMAAQLAAAAAADDRPVSAVVRQALRAVLPDLPSGASAAPAAAAGVVTPSAAAAALPYPASLHAGHMRRQADARAAQDAAHAEARERAIDETAAALKGFES